MAKKKFSEWDEYNVTVMRFVASWFPAVVIIIVLALLFFSVLGDLNAAIEDVAKVTNQ